MLALAPATASIATKIYGRWFQDRVSEFHPHMTVHCNHWNGSIYSCSAMPNELSQLFYGYSYSSVPVLESLSKPTNPIANQSPHCLPSPPILLYIHPRYHPFTALVAVQSTTLQNTTPHLTTQHHEYQSQCHPSKLQTPKGSQKSGTIQYPSSSPNTVGAMRLQSCIPLAMQYACWVLLLVLACACLVFGFHFLSFFLSLVQSALGIVVRRSFLCLSGWYRHSFLPSFSAAKRPAVNRKSLSRLRYTATSS